MNAKSFELLIKMNLNVSSLFRSTSPKFKDGKIKREKDVKMEEEDQEEKKKEKVPNYKTVNL